MQTIATIRFVVLTALLSLFPASLLGQSPDDHGNTRGLATPVGVNTARSGRLERRGDVDYFRVQVVSAGQLRIATSGSADTVGYLQGAQGQYLAANDNNGSSRNFRIERIVARGTYFVAVVGANRRTATGAYNLHVGFTAGRTAQDDHGNARAQATRVGTPSTTRGRLERRGDVDYFRISVTRSGQLRIATSGTTDTVGYLQDANGRQLTRNDNNGSNRNFRIVRNVTRGTHYVAVTGANRRTVIGAYNLHVGFTAGGGSGTPPDDHGNTWAQATRVGTPSTTRGNLERRGDVDYFRVDVPADGQLRIATSGTTDTYGFVGTSGRWLAQNDDGGANGNFRIERNVARGTHYVAVVGYQRHATGTYALHVGFTASDGGEDGRIPPGLPPEVPPRNPPQATGQNMPGLEIAGAGVTRRVLARNTRAAHVRLRAGQWFEPRDGRFQRMMVTETTTVPVGGTVDVPTACMQRNNPPPARGARFFSQPKATSGSVQQCQQRCLSSTGSSIQDCVWGCENEGGSNEGDNTGSSWRHIEEADATDCLDVALGRPTRIEGRYTGSGGFATIRNKCSMRLHVRDACISEGVSENYPLPGLYSFRGAGLGSVAAGGEKPGVAHFVGGSLPSGICAAEDYKVIACVWKDYGSYSPYFTMPDGSEHVCID